MDAPTHILSPEQAISALSLMPDPDAVRRLEAAILSSGQEIQVETHMMVHGGMGARTLFLRAGTVLTGALTNHDNICVVVGDIVVTTDAGPRRLTGYNVLPAVSGFKRAGYVLADTFWTTVWPTSFTDCIAAENDMTDEADMLQTRRASLIGADAPQLIEGA